mgnify:CR=1 FL=1
MIKQVTRRQFLQGSIVKDTNGDGKPDLWGLPCQTTWANL